MDNKPPAFERPPTTDVVSMSPTDAQAYLETRTFDRQRERKRERIARYKRDMEGNNWGDHTVITVTVLPDGREILANGHHRLWALSEASPNTRVAFLVVKRYVASQEDVDKVFAIYEDRGIVRDDSVSVFALLRDRITLLDQAQTRHALRAISIWQSGFVPASGNVNYKVDVTTETNNLVATEQTWSKVLRMVEGADHKVRRQAYAAPVLAAIAAITHINGDPAIDFFGRALSDDGLPISSPEKRIVEYLREKREGNKRGVKYVPTAQSRYITAAWNMYSEQKNREMTHVYVRIAGPSSPYNGKQRVLLVDGVYVAISPEPGAVLAAFEHNRSSSQEAATQI